MRSWVALSILPALAVSLYGADAKADYWTPWFDRDQPSGVCDCETTDALPGLCPNRIAIEVRTVDEHVPFSQTGKVARALTPEDGFACYNSDNGGDDTTTTCPDYEVRFLCEAATEYFTGSDTMLNLVRQLLGDCANSGTPAQRAACEGLNYVGGGSSTGQLDMLSTYTAGPTTRQTIAPMSRELNSAACGAKQASAKGWVVALDAISLVSSTAAGDVCDPPPIDEDPADGVQEFGANLRSSGFIKLDDLGRNKDGKPVNPTALYPRSADGILCQGCGPVVGGLPTSTTDDTYTFADWQDVLRVLFTGATHSMGNLRIGAATGAGANLANTTTIAAFCGGDLRRSLVKKWQQIIENCSSEGQCVGGVKRLFRPGDATGTTDLFLSLLNLPSIRNNPAPVQGGSLPFGAPQACGVPVPGSPFCNGNDQRDNDPIRVPCSTTTSPGQAVDMLCNRYVVDTGPTPGNAKDDEISNSIGFLVPIFVPEELTFAPNVPAPGLPPELPLPLPNISSVFPGPNYPVSISEDSDPTVVVQRDLDNVYENFRKFPRPPCSTTTALGRAPTDPDTGLQCSICPDGTPSLGGTCQVPATTGASGAYPHCINVNRANTAPNVAVVFSGNTCGPSFTSSCVPFRPEGRVYNAMVFNPPPSVPAPANYGNTSIPGVRLTQYSRVIIGSTPQPFRDITMALYRLRQTVRPVSPATIAPDVCTFDSSTLDIGCLVGNYGATECALGLAGREAADLANTVAMKVKAAPPSDALVRDRVYPLSRELYIETLDNVKGDQPGVFVGPLDTFQTNLASFMDYLDTNPATVNARADEFGFISVPLGAGGLQCRDFRANQLNPSLPAKMAGNMCSPSDSIDACAP